MRHVLKLPRVFLAAALLFASLPGAIAWADVAVPPLRTRVTDLTATLSADQSAALESKLAAFEQRKGSQIAVLLVPTTQPETIEQYSIRVVDQWKLGRKGVADGALLLIAKNDRTLRIEVGRGLEGAMPDAIAKRIVAEDITPLFKQGDFNGGINAGVDRMIKVVDGEPLPAPRRTAGASPSFELSDALIWGVLLVVFLGGILRSIFGKFFGSLFTGGIAGGAALFLGAGIAVGAVAGIIVFVLSLIGISFMGGGGMRGGGGGWSSGGGGWGGGGGGGGWSGGGGGDFGGGGASGRW